MSKEEEIFKIQIVESFTTKTKVIRIHNKDLSKERQTKLKDRRKILASDSGLLDLLDYAVSSGEAIYVFGELEEDVFIVEAKAPTQKW
jgi:hypothetical protein